jgi:sporulation protein YlmC with PRC-barrel domain
MDIPINAKASCENNVVGKSTCVIINPINHKLTHLVVRMDAFPHIERLVDVNLIEESTPEYIQLKCKQEDLKQMPLFVEYKFLTGDETEQEYTVASYRLWPYVLPMNEPIPVEYEHIPAGEIAFHRGSQVKAADGAVGQIDEFLVDPKSEEITHLVLRQGHIWGKKEISIPISDIDHIGEDIIYLKLDKQAIETLPEIPVRRHTRGKRTEPEAKK